MSRCLVYLVPGFFGFKSLGSLNYFHRVADTLAASLHQRGFNTRVLECMTQPTGSICRRAERLLDFVIDTGGLEADAIHFVGHSTGGLDVRLLVTPNVRLRMDDAGEQIGRNTRSVVAVSTPHFGTPLANFFTTVLGRQLLEILTVLATSKSGRQTIFVASQALRLVARIDDWIGRDNTFLDSLVERLLDRFTAHHDDPVWQFLREVAADQGAIIQLTPESMHLFNAAVTDRPGVQYSSLITAAPQPPRQYFSSEYLSVARSAMAAVFIVLHTVASRPHRHYPYPASSLDRLDELFPDIAITDRTNDGIVPTQSQAYGNILDLVVADHLDVVGQFPNASADPYSDWLPSGSGFNEDHFLRTWNRVADAIIAATDG